MLSLKSNNSNPSGKKGFRLKGFKTSEGVVVKAKFVPKLEAPTRDEETLGKGASSITTAVREMFTKPKATIDKSSAPIVETISFGVKEVPKEVAKGATKEAAKESLRKEKIQTQERVLVKEYSEALNKLSNMILEEEEADPYKEVPIYVPETRRGFANFIKHEYSDFALKPVSEQLPTAVGEKYPYQKFIREYMRQASPYRGILVYHGLGSGKTCTAIAASEALFSTANKKIIVMTPFSLRKTFLKEITFCGFRHFRLQNYWVELDKSDPTIVLFAKNVLNVSDAHIKKAKHIWVPDFNQTTPNYNSLSSDEQTEIREQILSILVYDAKTNPTGRIRFIHYNGIGAKSLKRIACDDPTFFDDSVIIVDEIHNLIRLMQGKIEQYLTFKPKVKRKVDLETVGVEHWNPSLCNSVMNYARGYSFYRLLLAAKNTKIIGLSGTPLINFPEELGILANVLHGYTAIIEGVISSNSEKQINALLTEFKYSDFVRTESDAHGTKFIISLLPEGIHKISNEEGEEGVERIPEGIDVPSREEILKELVETLRTNKYSFSTKPIVRALPLLPAYGEEFAQSFMDYNKTTITNKIVLTKRLSGLISYYKGSREDLMPKVIRDEVLRIPMSEYQQKIYMLERKAEIEKDKGKKKGGVEIWSEVYEIANMTNSTNYRMTSRQTCNFVFPSSIKRPRAMNKEEQNLEAPDVRDITEAEYISSKEFEESDEVPMVPEEEEEDENEGEGEGEDEEGEENENEGEEGEENENEGEENENEGEENENEGEENEEEAEEAEEENEGEAADEAEENEAEEDVSKKQKGGQPKTMREAMEARKAQKFEQDCKDGQRKGELYKDAILRSKECLAKHPLLLDKNGELPNLSPKFAKILSNIENAPGSSLVYSQFLDMEGIGIFRIVMDANGYAPIEIVSTASGPRFSEKTIRSFAKGNLQPRYITFSGAEKEDIRRLGLAVFNANFNELPESLSKVLYDANFEDNNNRQGQICRVFCITSAGAEGLSLKNVRAVHIMEPYWNDVRLKQVKGRAIRIGSHLDLLPKDRNVSIYTYISVFGTEAQKAKIGPMKIDETIVYSDSIERAAAIESKIPVEDIRTYTLTSDERLFVISERKKAVIGELETIMKSAAVDCELNYAENKDGSYYCLKLEGKVGDYLYHPDLSRDIDESESKHKIVETVERKVVTNFTYKNKLYSALAKDDKYIVYARENLEIPLGEMPSKDGKPALPILFY